MLFADQPGQIVYLTSAGASLYDRSHRLSTQAWPSEVIQNLEVADPAGLEGVMRQLVDRQALRDQRLMIVMDDSLVFQRSLQYADTAKDQAAIKEALERMPFAAETRGVVVAGGDMTMIVYVTNRALYEAARAACETAGARVEAAVPAPAYGLKAVTGQLTKTQLRTLLSERKPRQLTNFLAPQSS